MHNSLSCQNRYKMVSIENFSTTSPLKTEVFKPCKKSINALAHLWDVEPQRGGKASVERWSAAAGRQCMASVAPGRGRDPDLGACVASGLGRAPGRGSRPAWCRCETSGRGVASRRGGRRGDGARRDGSSARAVEGTRGGTAGRQLGEVAEAQRRGTAWLRLGSARWWRPHAGGVVARLGEVAEAPRGGTAGRRLGVVAEAPHGRTAGVAAPPDIIRLKCANHHQNDNQG